MNRSTILFDLDGTLTDPGEGIVNCIRVALDYAGLPHPSDARLMDCIGPPLQQSFAELGGRPEQIEPMVAAYRARFREAGMYENVVYPEIPSLLAELQARGFRLFVATSKAATLAVDVLEHFELRHYFAEVFGAHLDGRLSDKHELLAHIQSETDFLPADTVMIGDRKYDILAARASGLLAVGALWGYGSREELDEAGAHHLVTRPKVLSDLLC